MNEAEASSTIAHRLESLDRLLTWVKMILVGAMLLGGWAATLQLKILSLEDEVSAIRQTQQATASDISQLKDDSAVTKNDVRWIRDSMETQRKG